MKVTKKTVYSVKDFKLNFKPIETSIEIKKTKKGYTVKYLIQEEYSYSPREDDNLSNMVCFHRRYNLGDKHDYKQGNYNSWEKVLNTIKENNNNDIAVILPLYLYDHSGLSIRTYRHGYHDSWDCGQVGYIFITNKKIIEEFGEVTEQNIEKAKKVLLTELKLYDMYLKGEIYSCVVEQYDHKKNHLDYDIHGNSYGYNESLKELKEL